MYVCMCCVLNYTTSHALQDAALLDALLTELPSRVRRASSSDASLADLSFPIVVVAILGGTYPSITLGNTVHVAGKEDGVFMGRYGTAGMRFPPWSCRHWEEFMVFF